MPKIVGQDPSVVKRATCRECGAINEYKPNEVRTLWKSIDYGGGSDVGRGFNCAQCDKQVVTEHL